MAKAFRVLAAGLVFFCSAAAAAPKYFVTADIVRGRAGTPQGPGCVANTVFFPGEQVVWRAVVYDADTHAPLSQEQVKNLGVRVSIALDNGTSVNMRQGLHPPDPKAPKRDLFWSASYPVTAEAPVGTIKWTLTAADGQGNTAAFTPIGQGADINLLTIARPAGAQKTGAADGPGLYGQHCAACHQATGQGVAGAFPPLAGSKVVTGNGAYLAQVVLSGLEGKVNVKGQNYDGNMPGLGGVLSDAQMAQVLSYVRSAWDNKAPPVTEEVIKAERARAGNARDNYAKYPK